MDGAVPGIRLAEGVSPLRCGGAPVSQRRHRKSKRSRWAEYRKSVKKFRICGNGVGFAFRPLMGPLMAIGHSRSFARFTEKPRQDFFKKS
jgi:hypothetical protein